MTKRSTRIGGSAPKATTDQPGEAVPTPRQVAIYRMARICLIEWADLYTVMLEEKRHNWAQHPEREEWIRAEVARLREQLHALKVTEQTANVQVAKDYEAFLKGASTEAKP
jgi:hypothetical protein